jgi:hypothetical protein
MNESQEVLHQDHDKNGSGSSSGAQICINAAIMKIYFKVANYQI